MKTSQNGIHIIKQFEGCRLAAYKCAAGVPTIGYGHTAGVKMGQTITQEQADDFLKEDLRKYEKNVSKYDSKYHWNQNEFDALVSFAYNIGSVAQLTADGTRNRQTIAEKMLQYNKAAGKILDGLTRRRKAEQALFLKPVVQMAQNLKASSIEPCHVQLNYQAGHIYTIGTLKKGSRIKNMATARVGQSIWMYIGRNSKDKEQWVCADIGDKAYIK